MKFSFYTVALGLLLCSLLACEKDYTPKPRGYNRIELPEKNYSVYDSSCPFSFEIPAYARIEPYRGPDAKPCWLNLHFPYFSATLHLSYSAINSPEQFIGLTEDSRSLVYKHTIKAEEIIENYIEKKGKSGIVYELTGNTATSLQFFVSDSSRHFLRGSLYFNTRTNPDSIGPALHYLVKDVEHLLQSLEWK